MLMNWQTFLSLKIKDQTSIRKLIRLTRSLGLTKQVIKKMDTRTDKIIASEAEDLVLISGKDNN